MAKRATIKGKGAGILFGEASPPVESNNQAVQFSGGGATAKSGQPTEKVAAASTATNSSPARSPETAAASTAASSDLARLLEAEAEAATPASSSPARSLEAAASTPTPVKSTTAAAPSTPKREVEPTILPPSFAPAPIEPEVSFSVAAASVQTYEQPAVYEQAPAESPAATTVAAPTVTQPSPVVPAAVSTAAAIMPEPTGDIELAIKGPLTAKGFFAPSAGVSEESGGIEPTKTKLTPTTEKPTPADEKAEVADVLLAVGTKRRRELFNDIDLLYDRVATELSSNEEDANIATKYLSEARDILMENPRQFDEAEQRVTLVKAILVRRGQIRSWSYTYGMFVLLWAVAWLVLFGAGLIFEQSVARWVYFATTGQAAPDTLTMKDIFDPWGTMLMGGIGGITGILYSLYWHVAVKQDFDRQYMMWYLVQPIMGGVLGAVVYLVFASGFLSIQVITTGTSAQTLTDSMANPVVRALHWTVGWAAGFRQRFVYELIDRIIQLLTPTPRGEEEEGAEKVTTLKPTGSLTTTTTETALLTDAAALAAEAAAATGAGK